MGTGLIWASIAIAAFAAAAILQLIATTKAIRRIAKHLADDDKEE